MKSTRRSVQTSALFITDGAEDFEEKAWQLAIGLAKKGDCCYLVAIIRGKMPPGYRTVTLTPARRAWIADLIEGKVRRARGRPPKINYFDRQTSIAIRTNPFIKAMYREHKKKGSSGSRVGQFRG